MKQQRDRSLVHFTCVKLLSARAPFLLTRVGHRAVSPITSCVLEVIGHLSKKSKKSNHTETKRQINITCTRVGVFEIAVDSHKETCTDHKLDIGGIIVPIWWSSKVIELSERVAPLYCPIALLPQNVRPRLPAESRIHRCPSPPPPLHI